MRYLPTFPDAMISANSSSLACTVPTIEAVSPFGGLGHQLSGCDVGALLLGQMVRVDARNLFRRGRRAEARSVELVLLLRFAEANASGIAQHVSHRNRLRITGSR
jgi:hypothetical protein